MSGGGVSELLKHIPLLAKLSDAERSKLGSFLVEKSFNDRDRIITQGELGLGFYIITKGEVVVTLKNEKGIVSELGRLRDGDYFGETALINNAKRGASVTAVGPVSTFYLERAHFNSLFGQDRLNVQFAKRKAVTAEARTAHVGVAAIPAGAIKEKSAAVVSLISEAMRNNVLFMNLHTEHKAQIIAEMYRAEIKAGVNAIRQGDMGDNLYVVESGTFTVYVNDKQVATRGKGTCFGELALMYNSPRAATVTATTDCIVWVVDRFTFRRVVTDLGEKRFQLYVSFLKKVELLQPLAEYERKKIAEALEETKLHAGVTVFKQGDMGESLFIVYSGELSITKDGVEVMRVKEGDYFGERALLTNEVRAATVTATTNCTLLKLDRNAFSLLLGPLEDIMRKRVESYNATPVSPSSPGAAAVSPAPSSSPSSSSSVSSNATSDMIALSDLTPVATLGKGSFGHVQLVQHRVSGKTFALKSVNKAQIVQTGQQGHILSEKCVMERLNHPFLVRLHQTYKDKNRLFLLLECVMGGELFSVLREKTLFDEDTARFYAASIVLAFEYMHERNIIYRDLKPENLLLDSEGFLKITDFGFAKDIGDGRTWTLCGTPDYLAPEIVAGKGHGKGVDWWCLGIFLYEMLASYPPFYDEDPMKTYAKIMQGTINFPSHFSKEAVSLIKKLLQHKPTKRLGVVNGGAEGIKAHPFFAKSGFDWEALVQRKMKPPIVPKIKNALDTSNFDDYPDEPPLIEEYVDDGSNWDADF